MSSEIFYDKAFIKVGDGYIPLVNHGSSNCFDISCHGREIPEKHWSVLNYPYPGRFIFTPEEIHQIADAYEEENTNNRGGIKMSCKKTFDVGRFGIWIVSGMRYARTVEEYTQMGNRVQVIDYSDYSRHAVSTTEELMDKLKSFPDQKHIGITFSDDRNVIKVPITKQKGIDEAAEYYVLHSEKGFLVKVGAKKLWLTRSMDFGNVRKFLTRDDAKKYLEANKKKFEPVHFKVKKVKNNA